MSTVRKMHLLIEIDLSKCGQVEVQDIKLKYWILTDHLKFSCFIDNKKISSIWIKTGMRDNRLTRYSHFFQWTSLLRFWHVCWKLFSYHAFTFISLSVFVLEDHYSPSFLELIKSCLPLWNLITSLSVHPLFYGKLLGNVMQFLLQLSNNISLN